MNYYDEIKKELISNEIHKKIKDYSKNRYELQKYYNVGKILSKAENQYGKNIIKDYSKKLIKEIDKKYSTRYLYDIRKLYIFSKVHPLDAQLSMSHYRLLFPIDDKNKINYYIRQVIKRNLSKRQLSEIIKSKEYERLPIETRKKQSENEKVTDFVKNPIVIKRNSRYEKFSEKILQKLILEDIPSFLEELGEGFTFIKNEYKIKIGDRYNYIDLLLYNIKYKCYAAVELKTKEIKKQDIGQIQIYMNYIDENIKTIEENKTIGIIICKEENKYIIKYCSDKRIISRKYELI